MIRNGINRLTELPDLPYEKQYLMADWMSRYQIFAQQAEGMHPQMSLDDFNYTIKISPRYNYAFAITPKAGCTSLQKVLIDAEFGEAQHFPDPEYLHYSEFLPFLKPMQIGDPRVFFSRPDIFTFCFVRNPYTRLLSGYLDKIVGKKPQRDPILQLIGRAEEADYDMSFSEFATAVCRQPVSEQDNHWRVQYYLTYQEGIDYDFIGRFERLEADMRRVYERIGVEEFATPAAMGSSGVDSIGRRHATGADVLSDQYYTPELRAMVYEKYRPDFEHFGYAK